MCKMQREGMQIKTRPMLGMLRAGVQFSAIVFIDIGGEVQMMPIRFSILFFIVWIVGFACSQMLPEDYWYALGFIFGVLGTFANLIWDNSFKKGEK